MADTIVGTVGTDDLPADPVERVRVVAGRYRSAMLVHRDGGRLVAGTYAGTGKTLRVADVIVAALLEAGYPESDAARLCWAIVYFTLGLTQEQQTRADAPTQEVGRLLDTGAFPGTGQGRRTPHGRRLLRRPFRLRHRPALATPVKLRTTTEGCCGPRPVRGRVDPASRLSCPPHCASSTGRGGQR